MTTEELIETFRSIRDELEPRKVGNSLGISRVRKWCDESIQKLTIEQARQDNLLAADLAFQNEMDEALERR